MNVEANMPVVETIPFPSDFTDQPRILDGGLGEQADAAIHELGERGLVVAVGLTTEMLPEIQAMAVQPHIADYCSRDRTEDRFATKDSTEHWLSKGRAFFVLAKKLDNGKLHSVGYGWAGPGKSPEIPEAENTWAVRLGEEAVGQKLSEPFSRVIVEATQQLYGAKNVWLETWESNAAGVHTYGKLGFKRVSKKPAKRINAKGQQVDDARLFMSLA